MESNKYTVTKVTPAEGMQLCMLSYKDEKFSRFFLAPKWKDHIFQLMQDHDLPDALRQFLQDYDEALSAAMLEKGIGSEDAAIHLSGRRRIFESCLIGLAKSTYSGVAILGERMTVSQDGGILLDQDLVGQIVLYKPAAPEAEASSQHHPLQLIPDILASGRYARYGRLAGCVLCFAVILLWLVTPARKSWHEDAGIQPVQMRETTMEESGHLPKASGPCLSDTLRLLNQIAKDDTGRLRDMLAANALVFIDSEPELAADYVTSSYFRQDIVSREITGVVFDHVTGHAGYPKIKTIYIN